MRRRSYEIRAVADDDGRTITGLAVPFETETEIIPGFREKIARGAINLDTMPALFYRHSEPIGVITAMSEQADGLMIEARVSDTALGRDAATLARDGAIKSLSIGFFEREYTDSTTEDGATLRTQTSIDLREISLVPIPAYEDAKITAVREAQTPTTPTTNTTKGTLMTDQITRADLDTLADASTDLARRLSLLEATGPAAAPAPTETRSAGELLQAAVNGDETARNALAPFVGRAVNTTTAADGRINEPTFVRDLVRLIDNANPLMGLFSTGPLPADGNVLEFARLKANTLTVTEQTAEGATLPTGSVETEVATATVKTYGGGSVITRQTIDRARTNVLDLTLRGMAIEAGKRLATDFAAFFEKTVKGQAAKQITVNKGAKVMEWADVLAMMLDASERFEDIAMSCDGLIVNRTVFTALASLTDKSGRPLLTVTGNTGSNTIGTVSASGRYMDLDGLKVVSNRHLTATGMGTDIVGAFYNSEALRVYSSGLASLQDVGVLDLTNTFSVYQYAAMADEIPSALIPLQMRDAL
jgi:HK97 family phage prohead protease